MGKFLTFALFSILCLAGAHCCSEISRLLRGGSRAREGKMDPHLGLAFAAGGVFRISALLVGIGLFSAISYFAASDFRLWFGVLSLLDVVCGAWGVSLSLGMFHTAENVIETSTNSIISVRTADGEATELRFYKNEEEWPPLSLGFGSSPYIVPLDRAPAGRLEVLRKSFSKSLYLDPVSAGLLKESLNLGGAVHPLDIRGADEIASVENLLLNALTGRGGR